jgi:BolA protein
MDDLIKKLIEENFNPVEFELVNESRKHLGHAGDDGSGQTHYKLMVVSEMFQNRSRIDRQRAVMKVLNPAFSKGLHAVSMKLSAPGE